MKFFLNSPSVKMIVVVTNLGSISYLVKAKKYNRIEAIRVFNEAAMIERNILSEKPEVQQEAVLWAKETQERIRRSDEATKELKEKFTEL